MKIMKILLYLLLFLIILFMFLGGCKSVPYEDETEITGEEIAVEPSAETAVEEEQDKDIEYKVITKSRYFEMPDEIILYNKGEQKTIKKNTEIYNKIVYITNERFKKDCGMAEEVIPDEFVEEIKNKFAVEFIYDKEIQTIYACYEFSYEKNYTKILFPLPDFRAIFGPCENEFYEYQAGPIYVSIHPESDYLIEIIKEEFISR